MDMQWAQLSPEEKREQRFNWFLDAQGIKFTGPEAEKAYKVRAERLVSVLKVQEPDRVPVILPIGATPAYQYGLDYHTVMYDYEKAAEAWAKFNNEFEMDSYASPAMVLPGKIYDLLDYKLYVWPGHGLPTSARRFQYVEGEYMKEDEYDVLIKNPSDFFMRVYIPRIFGAFESFKLLQSIINIVELPSRYFIPYAFPAVQAAQQTLIEVGKELSKWMQFVFEFDRRGRESGFPSMMFILGLSPFDIIGDTLRGTRGIMKDMYRQPDKLIEAMDVIADLTIDSAISTANTLRGLMVTFPLHKGADGWMSQKQFDTFYWPPLRKVIHALINEGIIVSLFAEGGYNTRLESVNEFPKGAVSWLFDRTDMVRAKKILGENCCISGNVPASLLVTGTPREVKEYCRKLIEVCSKGGGYILASGSVGVDEAKLENLQAMMEAAKEYGVYK